MTTRRAIRIEFFGDEVDSLKLVDSLTGKIIESIDSINIYPGSHYATTSDVMEKAMVHIREEMLHRVSDFEDQQKLIEAQRIGERTMADMEMIKAIGYCKGIENYSRYLSGRKPGEPPPTLLDYMPEDTLVFIDESHQTVPQIGAMHKGDRSRKSSLIDFGFRLPSAFDNRPLTFDEFCELAGQTIYVSATPAVYELEQSGGISAEQVVRPTGLIDPAVVIRPVTGQVDDLLEEIRKRADAGQRVLVTCMTKRQAEDLTDYYHDLDVRARYLHSDIVTLERMAIIQDLRMGEFDVLIGINLLREGLDIPEVSLVAVLNADTEGFLRSETSLIQTSGRAARNVDGQVIFYADKMTGSITRAMSEMNRRREKQKAHNKEQGITPQSVRRHINEALISVYEQDYVTAPKQGEMGAEFLQEDEINRLIRKYDAAMKKAAKELMFEEAAQYRDKIKQLRRLSVA